MFIYIYLERERERHVCIYIYIYIEREIYIDATQNIHKRGCFPATRQQLAPRSLMRTPFLGGQ